MAKITYVNTTINSTKKIQFFDANAYINATSSGTLVVQGATATNVGVAGTVNIGGGGSQVINIGTASTQLIGFFNTTAAVRSTGWSISNVTTDKVFDANATTLDEIADSLGTLINQLKTQGLISA